MSYEIAAFVVKVLIFQLRDRQDEICLINAPQLATACTHAIITFYIYWYHFIVNKRTKEDKTDKTPKCRFHKMTYGKSD